MFLFPSYRHQSADSIICSKKAVLLDCDGVLYKLGNALEGAAEFVESIQKDKRVFFVTNSSDASPDHLVSALAKIGITATPDQVLSAPCITARVLKRRGITKVFLLASHNMVSQLRAEGIEAVVPDPDMPVDMLGRTHFPDPDVQAVIAGNTTVFNYSIIAQALQYLVRPGVAFIATNRDAVYPGPYAPLPDANSVVAALSGCCNGRQPELMGKPQPLVFDVLREEFGIDARDCVMIGDQLHTDIKLAKNGHAASLLVLTGVTPPSEWRSWVKASGIRPDAVVGGVSDLKYWRRTA
ncbi:HAD-superfamily hydrolase subfamily IIA [Carpediemonas membranifera]|uniref:HAD-superfamily hydrolase subfamily IIA n=1 Tax=Carpediemonas membranifera TaxID=201153 RepID=A0A8J6AXN6_9EUKA|nr:HAD-superfamily hydrolase subfamily IIA [Carpediemonas membranifera]|eukprot:KAG9395030.1 HAD-superfamily hydrolase subfamily IIA [Carpediemonas membranifera]